MKTVSVAYGNLAYTCKVRERKRIWSYKNRRELCGFDIERRKKIHAF